MLVRKIQRTASSILIGRQRTGRILSSSTLGSPVLADLGVVARLRSPVDVARRLEAKPDELRKILADIIVVNGQKCLNQSDEDGCSHAHCLLRGSTRNVRKIMSDFLFGPLHVYLV